MSFLLLMILLLFDVVFGDGMYKDDDMREKKKPVLKEYVYRTVYLCLYVTRNYIEQFVFCYSMHLLVV